MLLAGSRTLVSFDQALSASGFIGFSSASTTAGRGEAVDRAEICRCGNGWIRVDCGAVRGSPDQSRQCV
jgi:hypothetical protein